MVDVLLIIILVSVYFLPSIIATVRSHPERIFIDLLKRFLGWTIVGWIVALVWALNSDSKEKKSLGETTLGTRPVSISNDGRLLVAAAFACVAGVIGFLRFTQLGREMLLTLQVWLMLWT